jgi:phosphoglycolate phosphatase-like HAD superfamily hydrolase
LLILFDIDGTLVRSRPLAHQRAMAQAAVEVFGLPPDVDEAAVRSVEPWGKTDRWILRELLEAYGRGPPGAGDLERWERAACALYERLEHGAPSDADRRTAAVLDRLHGAGHRLALVTGNLEPIARRKLALRGLDRHFRAGEGGFGSDAEDRAELVRIACERAGSPPATATVLVGDTPLDVAAALGAEVRAIGVAGGHHSRADLLAAGADAVVDELGELEPLFAGELRTAAPRIPRR